MSGNKANSPSSGGNETESRSNSPIRNAIATATLSAGLALSGNPVIAETTAQMEAAREACIADSKAKSASLRLAETKRAAAAEFEKAGEFDKAKAEMEKVAKLEGKFKELVETCLDWKKLEAKLASNEAELASNNAEITKIAKLKKEADQINLEFQLLTQALKDYSNWKITVEQFKSKTANAWPFFERVKIHIAEARSMMTDSKYIQMYNQLEQDIQKFSQNPNISLAVKTAKK